MAARQAAHFRRERADTYSQDSRFQYTKSNTIKSPTEQSATGGRKRSGVAMAVDIGQSKLTRSNAQMKDDAKERRKKTHRNGESQEEVYALLHHYHGGKRRRIALVRWPP